MSVRRATDMSAMTAIAVKRYRGTDIFSVTKIFFLFNDRAKWAHYFFCCTLILLNAHLFYVMHV